MSGSAGLRCIQHTHFIENLLTHVSDNGVQMCMSTNYMNIAKIRTVECSLQSFMPYYKTLTISGYKVFELGTVNYKMHTL